MIPGACSPNRRKAPMYFPVTPRSSAISSHKVETPETIAHRIRRALPHIDADKVVVAPDCGLKYLPRDVAFGKMKAMADGAAIMRAEVEEN